MPARRTFARRFGDVDLDNHVEAPKVHIATRQNLDRDAMTLFLDQFGPDADRWMEAESSEGEFIAEAAGRLCYLSFAKPRPGGSKAYHKHILESGHGSVYQHSVYGFVIEGVSRTLTHELIRHSAGMAYSQVSQRYVDASDCRFVIPPLFEDAVRAARCRNQLDRVFASPDLDKEGRLQLWFEICDRYGFSDLDIINNKQDIKQFHSLADVGAIWIDAVAHSRRAYRLLETQALSVLASTLTTPNATAKRKAVREAARSVLPNATETKVFVTANIRALRNVFEQRCSRHADAEIRRLAMVWLGVMKHECPYVFDDFEVKHEGGITSAESKYRKV